MIRFYCPRCNTLLQTPDGSAGVKTNCGTCGQRLQVPTPPAPVNKTVLGQLAPDPANKTVLGQLPPDPAEESLPEALPVESAATETARPRGAREDYRDEGPGRHRERRCDYEDLNDFDEPREQWGFRCPFCRSRVRFLVRQRISPVGWVVMGVIAGVCVLTGLFLCVPLFLTPLCLLGLLIKEDYRICGDCGMKMP